MTTKEETAEKFIMADIKDAFLNRNITQDTIWLARHKTSRMTLLIYAGQRAFSLQSWSNSTDKSLDARAYAPVLPDDPCCIMHGLTYKERRRVMDMAVFTQKKLGRYLPLIENTLDALPFGPEKDKTFEELHGVRDALIKASFLQISEYIRKHFDFERACREAYTEAGQIVLLKQKILKNEEAIAGWRAEIEKLEAKIETQRFQNYPDEKRE